MIFPFGIEMAGEGGQGIVLAAVILADAAATYDGRYVAQSTSHGPEARGGLTQSEVLIGDRELDYPKLIRSDLLLAMNQGACDRYASRLKDDGLLVVDSTHVQHFPPRTLSAVAITRLCEEVTGRTVSANIVALGVIVGLTGVVSEIALESALRARVPGGSLEPNLKAFQAGLKAAKTFLP